MPNTALCRSVRFSRAVWILDGRLDSASEADNQKTNRLDPSESADHEASHYATNPDIYSDGSVRDDVARYDGADNRQDGSERNQNKPDEKKRERVVSVWFQHAPILPRREEGGKAGHSAVPLSRFRPGSRI